MLEALLSRKFIGFILISGMLFSLVLVDKITGAEFVSFTTLNLGIYVGGNVVQKATEKTE